MNNTNAELTPRTTSDLTATEYSAEEILAIFHEFYSTFEFGRVLVKLDIGKLQVRRKAKTLQEFRAITIALWEIALQKSFPEQADAFFTLFYQTSPIVNSNSRGSADFLARINTYRDLIKEKKDADFMPPALYYADLFAPKDTAHKAVALRVSLIIRKLYNHIFVSLV